jgi:hypothetical protein
VFAGVPHTDEWRKKKKKKSKKRNVGVLEKGK